MSDELEIMIDPDTIIQALLPFHEANGDKDQEVQSK